jgi:formate dehydrogenase maturation protein FdhE
MELGKQSGKRYIYIMYCMGCKHDWVYKGNNLDRSYCNNCENWKPFKIRMLRKIDITDIIKKAEISAIENYRDAPRVI